MKTKAKVTISRWTSNITGREEGVTIEIVDSVSGVHAVRADMELIDFAQCITGLSYRDAVARWAGLEFIGKKKVTEQRTAKLPKALKNTRSKVSAWLIKEKAEEGWMVDGYVGSQNSFGYKDGEDLVNYSVFKYVDCSEPSEDEMQ